MTMPQTHVFFANASATATLILTSSIVTVSGSLTATNIYTKTEVDNLLSPTATVTYVHEQLAVKANQATTLHQNRNR